MIPRSGPRIKKEMMALLAERGLSDLSFAVVASHAANPLLNGLTMKQVAARLQESDSADAQLEAARQLMLAGGASMVYHFMSDQDVERIMRHPYVGFASDSGLLTPGRGVPHPRGYGNAARVLGEYVRKRHVLPLEEAVRKMTSLPARHFRLDRRGQIKEGFAADVVIFDAATIRDAATFEQPHQYAEGIPYVVVNGVVVVRKGEHTRARAGVALTRGSSEARYGSQTEHGDNGERKRVSLLRSSFSVAPFEIRYSVTSELTHPAPDTPPPARAPPRPRPRGAAAWYRPRR